MVFMQRQFKLTLFKRAALVLCIGLALCVNVLVRAQEQSETPAQTPVQTIVIFGDSISAAFGMDLDKGYVNLLSESLGAQYRIVNASISGDTTVAGVARLPITLDELKPDLVLLELGANDGLQGLPIDAMKVNLASMIETIREAGVEVGLLGLTLPASYGPRYIDQFRAVFPALAEQYNIPWLDLYREQFVLEDGFIQDDGIHPTEKTQPIIRDMLLAFLKESGLLD